MKTNNLIQGTPAWHAYRAQHFNASDAAAMLGISPHKTRSQLLHEMATGITPDIDPATQRLFDAGHAAEAAARPMAEDIIGEGLYPVVGSDGKLSASFDGLTMDESIVFENKLMNVELADSLANGTIPDQYHPQLEQQLMVSGAEKALFMGTSQDGTAMEYAWYTSRPELRTAILQGWDQFSIDLLNYTPTETVASPIGKTPETLPALHIEVTGMVTASNLAEYKAHALAVFEAINRDLVTDSQFADAEKTIKWAGDVEQRLAAAKQHALSQTASIDELFRTIDDISAEARRVRLELDKLVKARKDSIRVEIVTSGIDALQLHCKALNERIGKPLLYMPAADFAGAIKGKRTLESMRDAVATELARAKIEANAMADRISVNLRTLNETPELAFLFSDVVQLVLKAPDDLAAVVQNRITAHHAKEASRIEAERASIRAQEQAKAEREARAKLLAEQAAADQLARDKAAYEQLERDEIARLARLNATMVVEAPAPASTVVPMPARVPVAQPAPTTAPTMRLGQISERLGFTLTAEFLKNLGFEPAATDKASKLFHEADFPLICMRLVSHIQNVQSRQAA